MILDRREKGQHFLDLICPDTLTRDTWFEVFNKIIDAMKDVGNQKEIEDYIKKLFNDADLDQNGRIDLVEFTRLLEGMKYKLDKDDIENLFDYAHKGETIEGGRKVLTIQDCLDIYNKFDMGEDVLDIFNVASSNKTTISAQEFQEFMIKEQGLSLTIDECRCIISDHEGGSPRRTPLQEVSLSKHGFNKMFKTSKIFKILNQIKSESVHQDMTQPLSHYWINSSHNTYLTGNQVLIDSFCSFFHVKFILMYRLQMKVQLMAM